jgi:hypothetical protein
MGFTVNRINRECNTSDFLVVIVFINMLYKCLDGLIVRKKRYVIIEKEFVETYVKIIGG